MDIKNINEVKVKFNRFLIFVGLIILFVACSSSKESASDANSGEQEVYVFDDVSDVKDEPTSHEATEVTTAQKVETQPLPPAESPQLVEGSHVVQVGAFSTIGKAENFVRDAENKIDYQLNISQSEKTGLFVVQLPPFKSRESAEKVRNELWNITQFKDAFIVPKK